METYTIEEKVLFVTSYFQGMTGRNDQESFSAVYPGRPIPSKSTILSVVEAYKSTGCVNSIHNKKIRPSTVEIEEIG